MYCHFYEQFALKDPAFAELKQMLERGYNMEIVGYDAFVPTEPLETHYLDDSRPFGHELVLYSLLKGEKPWSRFTVLFQHRDLYDSSPEESDEKTMERAVDPTQWVQEEVKYDQEVCDWDGECLSLDGPPPKSHRRFLRTTIFLCERCFEAGTGEGIVEYYTF